METPGARMSTHLPQFENVASLSWLSVAPTVIAVATLAGEKPQASWSSLPAAITYNYIGGDFTN